MNQPRQHQQMPQNEVMTKGAALASVLATLESRRDQIASVLPPDQTFESFHATINQALRGNPDLLDCEPRSLVNACVKAAYDGLRVDGREAVIVYDWLTPPGGGRKVKTARYMSMYQGMVQQVLRGGMVLACEADVIYANDEYALTRGTNPGILHKPLLVGDRGEMIAVYHVATLPSGLRTFVYLTKDQVLDIQQESKSGWKDGQPAGVWKRWPREQWKKTAHRLHRKTLPVGTHPLRDMDAEDDFPQFAQPGAHPQLTAQPRPTRQSIANQQGTESGLDLGMGSGAERDTTIIDQQREEQQQQRSKPVEQEKRHEQAREQQEERGADVELPADAAEWATWQKDVEAKIVAAKDGDAVDRIWADAQPVLKHASKAIRDDLTGKVTARNTDLALEAGAGAGSED